MQYAFCCCALLWDSVSACLDGIHQVSSLHVHEGLGVCVLGWNRKWHRGVGADGDLAMGWCVALASLGCCYFFVWHHVPETTSELSENKAASPREQVSCSHATNAPSHLWSHTRESKLPKELTPKELSLPCHAVPRAGGKVKSRHSAGSRNFMSFAGVILLLMSAWQLLFPHPRLCTCFFITTLHPPIQLQAEQPLCVQCNTSPWVVQQGKSGVDHQACGAWAPGDAGHFIRPLADLFLCDDGYLLWQVPAQTTNPSESLFHPRKPL